ncbi:MAG: hypothetical protein M1812_001257 [Candelaria pacifica]|nr:MAG: hypothetical protein M1812_001257 [Candelaria pacifica]
MEIANILIRKAARAFYEVEHVLVIDVLMVHSTLRDDDLAYALGMQTKVLHKLCGKLKEDRLLAVQTRPEIREGMQRPISRTWYFVDYHSTIDAIKYRLHRMYTDIDSQFQPNQEKKDYFCPRCKSRWTQMEVLDNVGLHGFLCHKCEFLLEREDETEGDRGGNEKLSRFMGQMAGLLDLLPQIDQVIVPESTFEKAFANHIPVQRNQLTNPSRPTETVNLGQQAPSTVKGLAQNTSQQISVSLAGSTEKTAAEHAAEQQKRAAVAEQNKLPEWHTNSTVTGEATALGIKEQAAKIERDTNGAVSFKEESVDEKNAENKESANVKAYYKALEEEQEKQAKEDMEADESSEDEDEEDGFEDVAGAGSGVGTPASSIAASNGAKPAIMNGTAKAALPSQGSESGTSGPVSSAGTPLTGTLEEDNPSAAKKVRIEEPGKVVDVKSSSVKIEADKAEVESDEDEGEFEDAL